jgi:hypothetical protein
MRQLQLPIVFLLVPGLYATCLRAKTAAAQTVLHYHFSSGVAHSWTNKTLTGSPPRWPQVPARSQGYETPGQANRDWCRAMEREHAGRQSTPAMVVHFATRPPATVASTEAPATPPLTQGIRWPAPLKSAAFAASRNRIEAPFRRNFSGGMQPSATEYRVMAETALQMRIDLQRMFGDKIFCGRDYVESGEFLVRLEAEAIDRATQVDVASSILVLARD